ncbi:DUF6802 family protein [Gordonia phosphorivorans]|uniref:DUF6802 family protein n=1 Tax=Gordonia phosphorivorans TaxID=1056982 RepID=A0ABV6HC16_9ACTN
MDVWDISDWDTGDRGAGDGGAGPLDFTETGALDGVGDESLPGHEGAPLDGHLWVFSGETAWDLGPARLDADSDGIPDSLTRGEDGQLTVYTDTDADGRVDRITELDPTGDYAVSHLDPETGRWWASRLGRLE